MRQIKPKSTYVTVRAGRDGPSKTVTLYDTTVAAVLKLLRERVGATDKKEGATENTS